MKWIAIIKIYSRKFKLDVYSPKDKSKPLICVLARFLNTVFCATIYSFTFKSGVRVSRWHVLPSLVNNESFARNHKRTYHYVPTCSYNTSYAQRRSTPCATLLLNDESLIKPMQFDVLIAELGKILEKLYIYSRQDTHWLDYSASESEPLTQFW